MAEKAEGSSEDKSIRPSRAGRDPAGEQVFPDGYSPAELREISIQASMSGPFPPPAMLAQYEDILPGSAERIFQLTEKEQAHRHDLESTGLRDEIFYRRLGMILGAASLVLILAVVALAAFLDQTAIALAVVGVGLVGIITAFIKGRSDG